MACRVDLMVVILVPLTLSEMMSFVPPPGHELTSRFSILKFSSRKSTFDSTDYRDVHLVLIAVLILSLNLSTLPT